MKLICAAVLAGGLVSSAAADTLFKLNFDEAASGTFTSGTVYTPGASEIINPAAGGLGVTTFAFADSGAPDDVDEVLADGASIGVPPAGIAGTSQGGKALLVDSGSGQDEGLRIFPENGLTSQSFTMEAIWYTNDITGGTNHGAMQTVIGDNWPELTILGPQPFEADFFIRPQGTNRLTYFGDKGSVNVNQANLNESYRWYHDAIVFTYNSSDPANSSLRGYRNGLLMGKATYNAAAGQSLELFGPTNIDNTGRRLTIGFNNSFEFRIEDHRRGLNGGVDAVAISNDALTTAMFELTYTADVVTPAHGGNNAARITNSTPAFTGTQDIGFDRDGARLAVTPGNVIRVSFWLRNGRAEESVMGRVSVASFNGDTHTGDTNRLEGITIPDGWTRYSFDHTVAADVTHLNLGFRPAFGGSSIVIDDVSAINLSVGNLELLTNGGFESWPGSATEAPTDWRFFAAGGPGEIERVAVPVTSADNWMLFE